MVLLMHCHLREIRILSGVLDPYYKRTISLNIFPLSSICLALTDTSTQPPVMIYNQI
jgi:hypothetical protein